MPPAATAGLKDCARRKYSILLSLHAVMQRTSTWPHPPGVAIAGHRGCFSVCWAWRCSPPAFFPAPRSTPSSILSSFFCLHGAGLFRCRCGRATLHHFRLRFFQIGGFFCAAFAVGWPVLARFASPCAPWILLSLPELGSPAWSFGDQRHHVAPTSRAATVLFKNFTQTDLRSSLAGRSSCKCLRAWLPELCGMTL